VSKFGTYKIIIKDRLIVEYHSGDININDFIESRKIISSAQDYNPDFDLIFDFRDVNMIVNEKDIKRFVSFFKGFNPILGKRRSAYLTEKPKHLVVTTLFPEGIKDSSIRPMTFSTIEALAEWLNKENINKDILTEIIEELKTYPTSLYRV
jgi:hypothetical protein